jgi:hypothetical protein
VGNYHYKGDPMEGINQVSIENTKKETKSASKRKWREIEAIKDKLNLEREMDGYDDPLSYYSDLIA